MTEEKIHFKNRSDEEIVGILHTPRSIPGSHQAEPITVIVCHGLRGNKDLEWIVELCSSLESAGMSALRFDFSGNGESEGRFVDSVFEKQVGDLTSAIDYLETKGYSRFATVGHSMGGGVAILHAATDSRIRYLVAIAAPSRPASNDAFVRGILTRLGIKEQDKYIAMLQGVDILGAARQVHATTLIVHGDKDTRIPLMQSEEIKKQITGAELHLILGADHYFDKKNDRDALVNAVTVWLKGMK